MKLHLFIVNLLILAVITFGCGQSSSNGQDGSDANMVSPAENVLVPSDESDDRPFHRKHHGFFHRKMLEIAKQVINDPERIQIIENEVEAIKELRKNRPRKRMKKEIFEGFAAENLDLSVFDEMHKNKIENIREHIKAMYPHLKKIIDTMTEEERAQIAEKMFEMRKEHRKDRDKHREKRREMFMKPFENLNLNKDQKQKIEELVSNMHDKKDEMRDKKRHRNRMEERMEQFVSGNVNLDEMLEKLENKSERKKEKFEVFKEYITELHSVLNAEQRKQFVENLQSMKGFHHKRCK